MSADATPYARLKVAQLALKVEAQCLALDEEKGCLWPASYAVRLRPCRRYQVPPARPI